MKEVLNPEKILRTDFRKGLSWIFLILILSSCMPAKTQQNSLRKSTPQIIGHRGFAGKYPQNTLPGFLEAVKAGVDAVELDVVVSEDNQLVVSHEPWMSAEYMLTPEGERIASTAERSLNLYSMKYEEIKQYEAGLGADRNHLQKKNIKASKPLLEDVFLAVENYIQQQDLQQVEYYIELKSSPEDYGVFQPHPPEFAELLLKEVWKKNLAEQVIIQSFDPKLLNELHKKDPEIRISFLVFEGELEEQLEKLDFLPHVYSPDHRMIQNEDFVNAVKEKNMMIIPWTVNSSLQLKKMQELGVDGIITDFPDKAIALIGNE